MKHPSSPGTTVGERRGLIVLLVIILLVIAISAVCKGDYIGSGTGVSERADSSSQAVSDSLVRALRDDTSTININSRKGRSNRRDSLRKSRAESHREPVVPRSPRDERVDR